MSERRRLLLRLAAQGLALLVADFLLLRVWGPDLVNLHKDWALIASLGCLLLAGALTAWLGWRLWLDGRRLMRLDRQGASVETERQRIK